MEHMEHMEHHHETKHKKPLFPVPAFCQRVGTGGYTLRKKSKQRKGRSYHEKHQHPDISDSVRFVL